VNAVTLAVNGGYNGLADRKARLENVRNYWASSALTAALSAIACCLPIVCRATATHASLCLEHEAIVFSCHVGKKTVSPLSAIRNAEAANLQVWTVWET